LAAEQECSVRTVHRDLAVLELAGVPYTYDWYHDCYRVHPDYRFPALNLTEDELLGQATAAVIAGAPGLDIGTGARPATRKLEVASGERVAQMLAEAQRITAVLDLKLADHRQHRDMLSTVQRALLSRRQLAGRYRSPHQPRTVSLRLHPCRLCLVRQAWYLIGRPADNDQLRTYRVTRFQSLRMLDDPADVPEEFDLRAYFGDAWGVYRGDKTYEVEIRFSPEAAALVTETTWHHTQTVRRHKDGSVTLGFRVDGLEEILWWVLGWSGRARVIRPPELRAMLVKQLRTALEMNQDPPGESREGLGGRHR
jgi:predicted DNA-binding transcriptional regulator YafY